MKTIRTSPPPYLCFVEELQALAEQAVDAEEAAGVGGRVEHQVAGHAHHDEGLAAAPLEHARGHGEGRLAVVQLDELQGLLVLRRR